MRPVRALSRSLLACASLLFLARAVAAQPTPGEEPPAPEASPDEKAPVAPPLLDAAPPLPEEGAPEPVVVEPDPDAARRVFTPAWPSGMLEPESGQLVVPEHLGYPEDERGVGMPANVETDLDKSFPKRDSLLPSIPPPRPYYEFKEGLYDRLGLKLAFSYQMLLLGASSAVPAGQGLSQGKQKAWAGSLLIEAKWVLFQREKDYPGSLVTSFDWRHTIQDSATPAFFLLDNGSLWPTEFYYIDWRPWFPVLFYEQAFKKDLFVLRMGNLTPMQFLDFFRFKDPRTSFTGAQLTAPAATMPFGAPGFGIQFDLRPIKDSELYFSGVVHDMNADVEKYSWNEFFTKGDLFYGLEIGYFWKRDPGDFDHVHVDVIYAAAPVDPSPVPGFFGVGTEPGWTVKGLGSKQIDRWVLFGSYTFNSSEGGGLGATLADHSVTGGLAFLRPLDIRGEWSLGFVWAKPIVRSQRDQYGLETYWKILFAEDVWVTPGLQLIFKPTYDPSTDVLAVGGVKLRVFF